MLNINYFKDWAMLLLSKNNQRIITQKFRANLKPVLLIPIFCLFILAGCSAIQPVRLLHKLMIQNKGSFKLTYSTFPASSIDRSSKFEKLGKFDSGHYKTIIKIPQLPKGELYVVKWERPLLDKYFQMEFSKEHLIHNGKLIGEDIPMIFTTSRGYLPGESVTYTMETKDGKLISNPITFCPHPIIRVLPSRETTLIAELTKLTPTTYKIYLEGIKTFEKLQVSWETADTIIEKKFRYSRRSGFSIMVEEAGQKGGFCDFSIATEKGTYFNLTLPWGVVLFNYLGGEVEPLVSNFLMDIE